MLPTASLLRARSRLLLLWPPLLTLLAQSLFASASSRLSYDVWSIEDGWQQDTVTSLVQTRDGYLWLGTYTGLVRFDGVRFFTFEASKTPGLQNNRITSLYEDAGGVLWIGHETGEVTSLSRGDFSPVHLGLAWPGGAVQAISSDEDGNIWLLNDTGFLLRVRDGASAVSPGGASPMRTATLTRACDGKLWVVSNGSVAILNHGKLSPFQFKGTGKNDFFSAVFPAQDGSMWVLGNGRLRKWRDGAWAKDLGESPFNQGVPTTLMETRSGALLGGTLRDGLYILASEAEALHFSRTNGLTHDWVRTICEDHEGNIWLGTGSGLATLRPRKVRMLSAPDLFEGRAALSFTARPDGSVWVGTEGAGLYHFDGQRWVSFRENSGLANLFVWSVLENNRGELFVGTWGGGVLKKKGERFENEGELAKITSPAVCMFEDKDGGLWFGTIAGVHRYQGGKITWSAGKDQLVLPDIRAITQTKDGTMWFGMSGGGLASLRNGQLKQFRRADGLASDFILSLYTEPEGTLWIGTSDKGLCRLKNGRFVGIGSAQGLACTVVAHIVDDAAGNLWLGSHSGIVRVSKAELTRCADGAQRLVQCSSYGKAEGLTTLSCSGGFQPGACRTGDGRLWFPTAKGLALIDPGNLTTNLVVPPVLIEELLVDGKPVQRQLSPVGRGKSSAARTLEIPGGKHRFEIRYTGLSFAAPDKVRFKSKLDGLENEWVDAGTERAAIFNYLQPGKYDFHVIACNNDGVWNTTGASLGFAVLPFFWQTLWFQTGSGVLGAGAVGAVVLWGTRRRLRHRLERLERQRAVERERARIARDIHDDLGASLTRITMLSQLVRSELDGNQPAAAEVDQIYGTARELTRAMDEIVWAVNPQHDTLDSLVTYLGRFAQTFLSTAGIRCRLDVPLGLPPWALTAEIRHNLFLAFKEALNNAVKHAHPTEVRISLELQPAGFVLCVADNGHGFEPASLNGSGPFPIDRVRLASGNGLLNMRKRLEEAGGRCDWQTAPQEGTRVKFTIPIKS